MSLKPGPNLPNDGLSIRKKPTAGEKRAIRKALKSWIPPALMVKRPDLPTRVPTTCVVCRKAGVSRGLHLQEFIAFMYAHVKPHPPCYGACPDHEEAVQEIAARYEPTREERFILECCRRAGVDPMPLLFVKIGAVQSNLLKKMRKDAKQSHARGKADRWARETYPGATLKELAPKLGYRTEAALKKALDRARKGQGGTKPKK